MVILLYNNNLVLPKGVFVVSSHNHKQCIKNAIVEADRICAERGVRFTELRKQILKMVWQGHKAVKAYDLLDQLSSEGGSAKPPTVYRALDFLMQQGFVHKIESLNAFVGCPHPAGSHVSQFLICDNCRNVTEVGASELDQNIIDQAANSGFAIKGQTIEIHGECADCITT